MSNSPTMNKILLDIDKVLAEADKEFRYTSEEIQNSNLSEEAKDRLVSAHKLVRVALLALPVESDQI